ncbi:GTP-binding protein 2 [Podospora aff. communis PSN243]|uniref:GTP-binding protein 2 n=1 Tax=Podospora aff. communis PSN243 TaxID=3040156 RepID=A0AAV9GGU9_9PEZI|nr:GTP-binding protein 2 [Podospora aff. communis PSN243]
MSVFTFDPDPPKAVASPWLKPADPSKPATVKGRPAIRRGSIESGVLSDYGVTKLKAEPQDGPMEYKLHLLLRPRRKYERTSTPTRISGSIQSRPPPLNPKSTKEVPAVGSASSQTRQDRLEHLTTQLLWRLQQSCPYHASSAAQGLVVPQLPSDTIAADAPVKLGKLLPGLESSRGALYEIGVADDGTLAGLTKDEIDESLATLRVMATSLGCSMKVLRIVDVGDCEWVENDDSEPTPVPDAEKPRHHARLWVAEALVRPHLSHRDGEKPSTPKPRLAEDLPDPKQGPLTIDQLRVTLTGPTTAGKSTILGTLSTGTLDNGRGKSRLSLLKHPHEVNTGVTSSLAQELLGYDEGKIINYGHSNAIEPWIDIHQFTKTGRLVFLVDSAGHPRYRRTVFRGLIGWAPHWTLLCIAADSSEPSSTAGGTSSAAEVLGPAGAAVDLVMDHLDLCLRLRLPLAIVITKLDLATKPSVAATLSKILTRVKAERRAPMMLKNGPPQDDLARVSDHDHSAIKKVMDALVAKDDLLSVVPIVLTSAVDGRGIGLLHALLQSLPLPPGPTSRDYIGAALNPEQPSCLFHIEDKFSLPASFALATRDVEQQTDTGTVVAGRLRFGTLSIGDNVVVGPFPPDDKEPRVATPEDHLTPGPDGLSLSHPSSAELNRIESKSVVSASTVKGEWHTAKIVSIRNLRLPVQTLTAGQVGSIGMVFDTPQHEGEIGSVHSSSIDKLRKGMVLAVPSQHMTATGLTLQAASGMTAVFEDTEAGSLKVGSLVNVYVASVRASARVLRVSKIAGQGFGSELPTEEIDDSFSLSEDIGVEDLEPSPVIEGGVEVQLELLNNREWIELGSRIMVVEGGNKDNKSGFEGYMGKIIEIEE